MYLCSKPDGLSQAMTHKHSVLRYFHTTAHGHAAEELSTQHRQSISATNVKEELVGGRTSVLQPTIGGDVVVRDERVEQIAVRLLLQLSVGYTDLRVIGGNEVVRRPVPYLSGEATVRCCELS